ncbi:helix-turn-helix domain-containing protein [candidate division KSB1 bacterium]|nr:helix-turn-helix domain-containing protein [candidate division KSB1 bacterium]
MLKPSKVKIGKWKKQFLENGLDGLIDLACPGRSVKYGPAIRHKIAAEACNTPQGRTHWTIRDLADHLDVDRGIDELVFKEETIKPRRIK